MTRQDVLNEIMKTTAKEIHGFDNAKLIEAILEAFENHVRIDQMKKDRKMTMETFKNLK
jgi:hypothetical protein